MSKKKKTLTPEQRATKEANKKKDRELQERKHARREEEEPLKTASLTPDHAGLLDGMRAAGNRPPIAGLTNGLLGDDPAAPSEDTWK